jgi:iron complex outermembrane receptor protein
MTKIQLAVSLVLSCTAATAAEKTNPTYDFHIPAESADAAVRDFGLQSGVAISADQSDLQGKRLNAVAGVLSVDMALTQLTQGTGLTYLFDGRSITVKAAQAAPVRMERMERPEIARGAPLLLEEIVVTARKREEPLEEIPVSAEVLQGSRLGLFNLNSFQEAASTLPSVHLASSGATGQIYFRGVGNNALSSLDQSVGTFLDDVYHGDAHFLVSPTFDLQRVEFLKGPQSTFFGNNAIAGAINVQTARPSLGETDMNVRVLAGMFDSYAAEGAVNLPIGETLAVRFAGILDGTNGWQRNPFAGNQPQQRNQGGRASLLWKPDDDLYITLKIEGANNVSHDGFRIDNCPPPAPFVAAGFCAAAQNLPLNVHTNTTLPGQGTDFSSLEYVLTVNYAVAGQRITSVTAGSQFTSDQRLDAAGLPAQAFTILFDKNYKQFSQELRIASQTDQPVEYLAGLYAQVDRTSGRPNDINYFFASPLIESIPPLAPLVPYLPLGNTGTFVQEEHSYAAFASLGLHITQDLKVTASARDTAVYKNDANSGAQLYGTATQTFGGIQPLPAALQPLAGAVLGTPQSIVGAASYHGVTPSLALEYNVLSSLMLYGRYDQGFLAGTPQQTGPQSGFIKPEHVNSYEAGAKGSFGPVHASFDVFRSVYRDLQVASSIFDAQGNLVTDLTNAGKTLSQGAEVTIRWAATQNLQVSLNTTYLDSHYVSYPNVSQTALQSFCHTHAAAAGCISAFGGDPGTVQDLSGRPTQFAPQWSGALTSTYTHDIGALHLTGEASAYYTTSYFDGNTGLDDPLLTQAGYVRLDGRLTLETPERAWAFDFLARNVSDKLVTLGGTGATNLPISLGSTIRQDQEPRNLSLQVRYHF